MHLLLLIFLLLLSACSNTPREVKASIPLVTLSAEKPSEVEIPQKYWTALSDNNQATLKHDVFRVQLGSLYVSALGTKCRSLLLIDSKGREEDRVACQLSYLENANKVTGWFIENQIIESTSYAEL